MARTARLANIRLIPAVAAVIALALSGCAAGQVAQTAMEVAAVDGGNATVGHLGVRNVRFAATDAGTYPAGADLPIKLWVSNASTASDSLTAVSTPAAATVEISGSADFAPQTLIEVTDSTPLKITVSGLTAPLPYGHSIPVTFTFQQAGVVTLNVPIEIPAARGTETRDTVNVLPGEPGNIWFGGGGESGH